MAPYQTAQVCATSHVYGHLCNLYVVWYINSRFSTKLLIILGGVSYGNNKLQGYYRTTVDGDHFIPVYCCPNLYNRTNSIYDFVLPNNNATTMKDNIYPIIVSIEDLKRLPLNKQSRVIVLRDYQSYTIKLFSGDKLIYHARRISLWIYTSTKKTI